MPDKSKKIKIVFDQELVGDISATPTPVLTYKVGTTNLSTGKTASASSTTSGFNASYLNNDSLVTAWSTTSGINSWIKIDLGSSLYSAGMNLYFGNYNIPRAYTVSGSNDNSVFNNIISGEFYNEMGWQDIYYNRQQYRYWKVTFSSVWQPTSSTVAVYEWKVLDATPAGNDGAFQVWSLEEKYVGSTPNMITRIHEIDSVVRGDSNSVVLNLKPNFRLKNVWDYINVSYTKNKGRLKGVIAFVDNFAISATPNGLTLVPNPHSTDHLRVGLSATPTIDFIEVNYKSGYEPDEHLTADITGVVIDFIATGTENP